MILSQRLCWFVSVAAISTAAFVAPGSGSGPALANGIIVNATAPNWALGNPQFPKLGACSDGVIGAAAFNCGGASDVLAFQNQFGGPVAFGWLTEAGEALKPFPGASIWWIDIRIPNARWLFQAGGFWRDGDEAAGVASDYIGFINSPFFANGRFGLANLLLVSNVSDDPNAPFPATSFFDIFTDLSLDAGAQAFMNDPNNQTDLTGSVDTGANCTPTTQTSDPSADNPFPNGLPDLTTDCGALDLSSFAPRISPVPEPGSLAILASALAGLGFIRRRRRTTRSLA